MRNDTAVLDRAAAYIWQRSVSDSFSKADALQRYNYCRQQLFREPRTCAGRACDRRWVMLWLRVYVDTLCSDELAALADSM